ncbi:leucine-rich repeats and immunoglobulin-like domains protein 3 isoform X1 [Lampetra planeri]
MAPTPLSFASSTSSTSSSSFYHLNVRSFFSSTSLLLLMMLLPLLLLLPSAEQQAQGSPRCPPGCSCRGDGADCGRAALGRIPAGLPGEVAQLELQHNQIANILKDALRHLVNLQKLDLSYNQLTTVNPEALDGLVNLHEVKLNHNHLLEVPDLGSATGSITTLSLQHNRIRAIAAKDFHKYSSLESLELSNNHITELKAGSFPEGMRLKHLNLNGNKISLLELGCLDNLSQSLLSLKLNKNRITSLAPKLFKLPHLQHLELTRNRIKRIESLSFFGLESLQSLRLQRNNIGRLMDGAFWRLEKLEILHLDFNALTNVTKGWLYGLSSLQQLNMSHNNVSRIDLDAWEFCQKLDELDLSHNHLSRIEEGTFVGLGMLRSLLLAHNHLSNIADGAFKELRSLLTLDLAGNEISWTIEDMHGAFTGLENLNKLVLSENKIKSIAKKAFIGLERLQYLDLSNNALMSIQDGSFSSLKALTEMRLNSSSLLCDCTLKWLPPWLEERGFRDTIEADCAHPEWLKGRDIFSVEPDSYVCDTFPKPQISVQPETTMALRGSNVTFVCSARSSSDSPITFSWKKDNEVISDGHVENYAQVREREEEVTEYTTRLHLISVDFKHEGRYQCVISNHFGASYSNKAKLTVNIFPSFAKLPRDITIRAGAKARLECAAEGHPVPQIAWQKDGGTDFPAARERRMHVMPKDDVFFIMDVKPEDMGVYSCTAQNGAGTITANATLTVLETPSFVRPLEDRTVVVGETAVLQCIAGGSPAPKISWTKDGGVLSVTERHFFTASNQLLIIVGSGAEDAGRYTCEMSNTLGTERGDIVLKVTPSPNCEPATPLKIDDGSTVLGIVTIAVVCCVVGTSLVWVIIIYHTRRKSEEYSSTNTGEMRNETMVPPDVPSCLSSQGALSERQDVLGQIGDVGPNHQPNIGALQPNGHLAQHRGGGGGHCHVEMESDADSPAGPLLFQPQASGAELRVLYSKREPRGHLARQQAADMTRDAALLPNGNPVDCDDVISEDEDGGGESSDDGMAPQQPDSACSPPTSNGSHIYPSNHDRLAGPTDSWKGCPSKCADEACARSVRRSPADTHALGCPRQPPPGGQVEEPPFPDGGVAAPAAAAAAAVPPAAETTGRSEPLGQRTREASQPQPRRIKT